MTKDADCTSLACDGFGLLITLLQLGQFIPQHLEMATDRSVVGVSPWLLFFGGLYSHLAALDIVMTAGTDLLACDGSAYRCFMRGQPMLQMVGSAFLCGTMWYWFLKYHHDSVESMDESELELRSNFFYSFFSARHFFYLFVFLATLSSLWGAFFVVYFGSNSSFSRHFAHACGLLSAVLNAVMWIPQICVTFIYGHKGALSIGWVFASVVMDVVYSVYLALGVGVDFSVWANNVPDGIFCSLLLCMILRFSYNDEVRGLDDFGKESFGNGEDGALLSKKCIRNTVPLYEAI